MSTRSLTDVPEQKHSAMKAAAERPVSGPAASDVLAAGGGLELPGREAAGPEPAIALDGDEPHEPIPGEHDNSTLTHREPGAIGGAFNGADNVPDEGGSSDAAAMRESNRVGGGGDGERRFRAKKGKKGER